MVYEVDEAAKERRNHMDDGGIEAVTKKKVVPSTPMGNHVHIKGVVLHLTQPITRTTKKLKECQSCVDREVGKNGRIASMRTLI